MRELKGRIGHWSLAFALLATALAGCKQPDANGGGTSGTTPTAGGTTGANGGATSSGGAAAGGAAANVSLAPPYQGADIVLGEYASLTGDTATFGTSTHNAITMALDEINAKGGVLGKKVKVVVVDDASQTAQAATAVLRLINQNKVLAILGEVASSRSLAAAPICQKAGVPMISPSSTNPKVTKVGDYIFRTCFTDTFQGAVDANFAFNELKARKVAVLTDNASDYSKGLSEAFTTQFKKLGGTITTNSFYGKDEKDFRAQLTSIKAGSPDVIFVPGYYTEVGNIAVQARSLGIKQPMLGGDGWDSPKLTEIGKKYIEGSYFSNHYSPDSPDPRVKKFVADFKKRFGGTPDALAAVGYDAAYVMVDAIKRAGSTDRAKIRDAIASTKKFPGVTGTITIDAERNSLKSITILQIKNGKFAPVKVIAPQ